MSARLFIRRAGPASSLQDMGRVGQIAQGVARGGAADRVALLEAAALLSAPAPLAAIEMAGAGGVFESDAPMRFALTGAPMKARMSGTLIGWNESHVLQPGETLEIGGAAGGVYGYLTPAGGVLSECWLGSQSVQAALGIGAMFATGDRVAIGDDPAPDTGLSVITPVARFSGGTVRMMPGPQTGLFSADTLKRVQRTVFQRDARSNRQGVRLSHNGAPFPADDAAGLASDFITVGDVQMTGDGVPYVLMADCQTIGGYPRLGTVLPADLPILAQAPMGAALRLKMLDVQQADAIWQSEPEILRRLRGQVRPKTRDLHAMRDLLSYQLIGGVTRGDDGEGT